MSGLPPASKPPDPRAALPGPPVTALFGAALFLAAALMFAVQPMAGKMLLPLVGGTPAGWIVALAFFQLMLLAGYLLAHLLTRATPRAHGAAYLALLVLGSLFLPVRLAPVGGAALSAAGVFGLLGAKLAAPFIALSASSSTLQRLFASSGHRAARDPYFLYAASNLGSFAGLLLYPFLFEREWGLAEQARLWYCGYGLLIAAALVCLLPAGKAAAPAPLAMKNTPRARRAARGRRLEWLLLGFFPSALLLAVTTHISTAIFSAPLLWVLPLSLYLLTFVAAFARKQRMPSAFLARLQPPAVAVALGFLLIFTVDVRTSWYAAALQLAAFTVTALLCHTRLAEKRPRESVRLTEYYLLIAAGGALGGLLNAFVVPAVLDRLIEYPALLCLSCFMNPRLRAAWSGAAKGLFGLSLALLALYFYYVRHGAALLAAPISVLGPDAGTTLADLLLFAVLLALCTHPRNALLGGLIVLLLAEFAIPQSVLLARRNFYGVLRVEDYPMDIGGKAYRAHYLYHGTTTHGLEIMAPAFARTPTAYFTRGGPVGDVFRLAAPKDIAVIGLGAGTMNCYATKNNNFSFFEIDPGVAAIAHDPRLFAFLSGCAAARPAELVIGDGRLELGKSARRFDLVMLDAFTAETIPAHLLTTDAMSVYMKHLRPGGILLFNLSNRYFNLAGALARNAQALGLAHRLRLYIPDETAEPYAFPSQWLAVARTDSDLSRLAGAGWVTLPPPPGLRPWTDDYTNLLGVLNFGLIFGTTAGNGR